MKGLVKTKLSRSILDAAFGEFVRQVQYKAAWNFRHSVKVGRYFPSTKLCPECGALNPNLTLAEGGGCAFLAELTRSRPQRK